MPCSLALPLLAVLAAPPLALGSPSASGSPFAQDAGLLVDANSEPLDLFEALDDTRLIGEALGRLWVSGRRPGVETGVWTLGPGTVGLQPFPILGPGPELELAEGLAEVAELPGGRALLAVSFSSGSVRLYSTDGTPAGTVDLELPLEDDSLSFSAAARRPGIVVRGELAFVLGLRSFSDREVYSTDGTLAGTVLRDDPIELFGLTGRPGFLWPFLDGVVYTVETLAGPTELRWLRGATAGPAVLLESVVGVQFELDAEEVSGKLVFTWPVIPGGSDEHLRVSDGTPSGTGTLVDLPLAEFEAPLLLGDSGGLAWFTADSDAFGRELWRTDGSTAGTFRIVDLNPGPGSAFDFFSEGAPLGAGFVFAGDGPFGCEPYFTDGTAAGTVLLADIEPGFPSDSDPREFVALGSSVGFAAGQDSLPAVIGREAWLTDGTPGGTVLVEELLPGPPSTDPESLAGFGGALHFVASATDSDPAIYRGRPSSIDEVGQVAARQGTASSFPFQFASAGGRGYFAATPDPGSDIVQLWTTDGSSAGTAPLPGIADQLVQRLGVLDSKLLFIRRSIPFLSQPEPWITDGTAPGTFALSTAGEPTSSQGVPVGSASPQLAGEAFFIGRTAAAGRELWRTDGTPAGTQLVVDLEPGPSDGAEVGSVSRVGNRLVFRSRPGGVFGPAPTLQASDGTAAGTGPLAAAALAGRSLRRSAGFGELLAFGMDVDASPGDYELWLSDGTDAGTHLVGTYAGELRGLTAGRERLVALEDGGLFGVALDGSREALLPPFFGAGLVVLGPREVTGLVPFELTEGGPAAVGLWVTDGTAAGTVFVSDQFSRSREATLGDAELVLFTRHTLEAGIELWATDGTPGGERLVVDLAPGVPSSAPSPSAALAGGRQLLSAYGIDSGEEPHFLDVVAAGGFVARPFGSGCGAFGSPDLRLSGEPRLGASVAFELTDFAPSAVARLYLGLGSAAAPFGGCRVYLSGAPFAIGTVPLDGAGAGGLGLTIPAEPTLLGLPLFLQAAGTGPGGPAPNGLELSDGFELRIGMP